MWQEQGRVIGIHKTGGIAQLDLRTTQMDLEGGFSDINADIDRIDSYIHIILTDNEACSNSSLQYELLVATNALAAVRVWSNGTCGSGWASDWCLKTVRGLGELARATTAPCAGAADSLSCVSKKA